MKKVFFAITASLVIVACNGKKETTETSGNSDSAAVEAPATTSETTVSADTNAATPDSAAAKAKEDSIIKAHGHKH
ncbi:hypothetical protein J2O09_04050 [Elizabethkingia anophelis]|uniref:hypothetical protein n=1 Tax=Elizabethkingia anophelis TaxID=1117645 RepID=UPI0020B8A9E4|nr:hypothetical protein [Elizabethkingia anophelis]UTG62142.1 hypothetical protein J2O09_04050 [Elizabethkingia anophelis]UXM68411.1 hypothetical protein N7E57_04055 [Elizabethkingia anophelis]